MSRTVNKKMRKKSAPGADYALGILKRCAKCGRGTKKMDRTRCKTCKSTKFIKSESMGEGFFNKGLFNKEAMKLAAKDAKKLCKARSRVISLKDTDDFGFSQKTGDIAIDQSKHLDASKEQKRLRKWNKMCSGQMLRHPKFRERLEKGVPTPMRGFVWYKLVGEPARKALESTLPALVSGEGLPDSYFEYFVRLAKLHPTDHTRENGTLDRDLDRTFPNSVQFSVAGGEGQNRLKRVLLAYASYNPQLGYTQGMNFIAGMLLGFMPEKEAFWVLVGLMDRKPFELNLMFADKMPLAHTWFYCMDKLLEQRIPAVYKKFKEFGFSPVMYAAEWIFSLFCKTLAKSLVARVWDVFFMDGWPAIFSTALAIIYKNRKAIKKTTEAADLMMLIRGWTSSINGDKIRTYSERPALKVAKSQLDALRREHEIKFPDRRSVKSSHSGNSSAASASVSAGASPSAVRANNPKGSASVSADASSSAVRANSPKGYDDEDDEEFSNDDPSPYV